MSYYAELDADQLVVRVIVADDPQWIADNLGGTWVQTADPYAAPTEVTYAGPGMGHDPGVPEAFVADHWTADKATIPDLETGRYFYATQGMLTWFEGKAWRNLMPDGNPNVWQPPTNWREYPMGDQYPLWVQPSGAVDAYPLGFVVEHDGTAWTSLIAANVWQPGAPGSENLWEVLR